MSSISGSAHVNPVLASVRSKLQKLKEDAIKYRDGNRETFTLANPEKTNNKLQEFVDKPLPGLKTVDIDGTSVQVLDLDSSSVEIIEKEVETRINRVFDSFKFDPQNMEQSLTDITQALNDLKNAIVVPSEVFSVPKYDQIIQNDILKYLEYVTESIANHINVIQVETINSYTPDSLNFSSFASFLKNAGKSYADQKTGGGMLGGGQNTRIFNPERIQQDIAVFLQHIIPL